MPIYEYECESCGNRYAVLVHMKDSTETESCPRCGSQQARKLISSVSVVRSTSQKEKDREKALRAVDPTKPQEVARYFKEHGSRFGDEDFRGTNAWQDAVERVAEGGPTLDE